MVELRHPRGDDGDGLIGLARAIESLDEAARLLNEAYTIGLWVRADDCSDNRNRRRVLREADWAASSAERELAGNAALAPLREEIRAIVAALEPLPDFVTDTMIDNPPELDSRIRHALEQIENVRAHAAVRLADGT